MPQCISPTAANVFLALHVEQKSLYQKNAELIDMYREKSKKHSQTQYLYDTLKKKVMQSQIQTAATNTVTQLQSIGGMTRAGTYNGGTRLSDKIKPGARRRKPINYTITNRNGVEQLHHHQRSGSVSQNSTDAIAMPPPQRSFGGTRIRLL